VFGCVEIHFSRHRTEANKKIHDTYIYVEANNIVIGAMLNTIHMHIYISNANHDKLSLFKSTKFPAT